MINRAILPLLVIGTLVGGAVLIRSRLWPPEPYEFVMSWGEKGSDDGEFLYVEDLEIDANGHLLITDALSAYVQVFTTDGTFLTKFGGKGNRDDSFEKPEGIVVDAEGLAGGRKGFLFRPGIAVVAHERHWHVEERRDDGS